MQDEPKIWFIRHLQGAKKGNQAADYTDYADCF